MFSSAHFSHNCNKGAYTNVIYILEIFFCEFVSTPERIGSNKRWDISNHKYNAAPFSCLSVTESPTAVPTKVPTSTPTKFPSLAPTGNIYNHFRLCLML